MVATDKTTCNTGYNLGDAELERRYNLYVEDKFDNGYTHMAILRVLTGQVSVPLQLDADATPEDIRAAAIKESPHALEFCRAFDLSEPFEDSEIKLDDVAGLYERQEKPLEHLMEMQ